MSVQALAIEMLRRVIWERDGGRCGICGESVAFAGMEIDHIIPVSMRGDHSLANLQAAHRICNVRKGGKNRLPREQPATTVVASPVGRLTTNPGLTAKEVAERLRVKVITVQRWLAAGKLRGSKLPSGEWRIPAVEVERLERGG
jgi:excisionase family DNA binding protein